MLLGENGAGKSTLMKILSGAYRKDSGEIRIRDQAVEIAEPAPRARARHPRHLPGAQSRSSAVGRRKHFPRRRADAAARRHRPPEALRPDHGAARGSRDEPRGRHAAVPAQPGAAADGGDRQGASRSPASILVMDEPTSALTSREVDQLFVLIERLVARGVALVYITHRLDEVYRIGHRVTVLRDGANVATTLLSDVTVAELVRLMANRDLSEHFPRRRGAPGADLLAVERRRPQRCAQRHQLHAACRRSRRRRRAARRRTKRARARARRRRSRRHRPHHLRRRSGGLSQSGRRDRQGHRPAAGRSQGRGPGRRADGCAQRRPAPRPPAGHRRLSAGAAAEERLADPVVADLRVKATSTQEVRLLSGGNQQKVVLGKWLAGAARIFIFDEPTRGVDVGAKVEIYQLMNRLTESGAGILMISSELPELLGMSDRILVMRGGTDPGRVRRRRCHAGARLERRARIERSGALRARRFGTLIGLLLLCACLVGADAAFPDALEPAERRPADQHQRHRRRGHDVRDHLRRHRSLRRIDRGAVGSGARHAAAKRLPSCRGGAGRARRRHRLRAAQRHRSSASAGCRRSSRHSA